MKTSDTVLDETPAAHVARIVLNRPETRNAQDTRMLYDLNDAFDVAARDDAQFSDPVVGFGVCGVEFFMHQLAHTHWLKLHGSLVDPTGLPPEAARAAKASRV